MICGSERGLLFVEFFGFALQLLKEGWVGKERCEDRLCLSLVDEEALLLDGTHQGFSCLLDTLESSQTEGLEVFDPTISPELIQYLKGTLIILESHQRYSSVVVGILT